MEIPTVRDRLSAAEIEGYHRSGVWTEEVFDDLLSRAADERPDKVFVTDGTTSMTYRNVYDGSLRLATGLRSAGVDPGDRVAVQLPNWAEFVVVAAAIARLGAITVPIMPIYRREEVGHVLDDAEVSVVVTPGTFKGFGFLAMHRALAAERGTVHTIVVVRDDVAAAAPSDDRTTTVRSLRALTPEVESASADADLGTPVTADDAFVIVYTSGTTAHPKGCVHTFNTYVSGARALGVAFAYTEDDVQFGPSPVTHTTGLVTSVLLPLLHGAATHLMPDWDPVRGLAEIERYRCTASVTATAFIQMLLDVYDPQRHDASSLRLWVSAGAPIPRAVVARARGVLPQAKILSLYGRSENLTTTTCTAADDPERALTSDGAALPFSEVQVVDELGGAVPVGEVGDIAYRGPSHMLGYLNRPEETASLFTPSGSSRSGDLGRMDADGYVRVTGRTKDIIIRGGMNISVREIEDLLAEHPGITRAAAVGMPDRRLGERVCVYLVPADPEAPPSLHTLRDHLLERGVALQKVPERVEVVDSLPTTATGKVQKHLLRRDVARKLEADRAPVAT